MGKLIRNILLLMGLYLLIFWPLHSYFDSYYKQDFDLCNKQEWLLSLKDSSYQDAFIGSSRVFNMLDMKVVEEKTGRSSINLASSGSNFAENCLLLHLFTQNNNQIERLFVQVDVYGLDSKYRYSYPFHDYKYLPYLGDPLVDEVFAEAVPPYKFLLWKYLPFSKYIEFNDEYSLYKHLRGGYNCTQSEFVASQGAMLLPEGEWNDHHKSKYEMEVDPLDLKFLKKLAQLGKEKGMEVWFYQAPEHLHYVSKQKKRKEAQATYTSWAAKNGIPYLAFEEEAELVQDSTLYNDYTHLNKRGSAIFSEKLAEKINAFQSRDNSITYQEKSND